MSTHREKLIRATFELQRDLTWAETLEPRFRAGGVGGAEMAVFREQWNQHTENKDWDWWRNEAKRNSTSELEDMRMDSVEKLDALGMMQHKSKSGASDQEKFQQVLKGAVNTKEQAQGRSREKEHKGRDL